MAKTPQTIMEEARKKNAAAAALEAAPPTNELDALLGELGGGAPAEPVAPAPVEETITLVEEPNIVIEPVTPVIEEPKTVIEEYVPDANIAPAVPVAVDPAPVVAPTPDPEPAPAVREEPEHRHLDKATLAEIEAGRAALAKYK